MYYNFIRFGSPFDFGANYNLTTNDMTSRGFSFARIPSALWSYFFQPANITARFPYVHPAAFHTDFLIKSITEQTYGGIFNNLLLLACFMVFKCRRALKEKGLYFFALTSILLSFALGILCAQVAGILARYCTDFTWLMLLPACIIVLLAQERLAPGQKQYVYLFVLISLFVSLGFNILSCIGLWREYWSGMGGVNIYYLIRNAIQFWL